MPDREATFAAFVRTRWGRLVRLAYSLTLDVGRAEDLVQESLAKMWAVWPRVRDGNPDAYVRRTIVNGAISASRRRWRAEEPRWDVPDIPTGLGVDGAGTDQLDLRDLLSRELAELSVLQRVVVVLRYAEDLSEQQVAEMLGVAPGTVKTHASRGLARLRRRIPPAVTGSGPVTGRTTGRPVSSRPVAGRPVAGRPVAGRPVAGRPGPGPDGDPPGPAFSP